jgi:glycosyltransferase involved in cell wall biosynthesis
MTAPLSLAFITSLPRYGGGEKWMLRAAAAMAERGHRICLIGQPGAEIVRRASALDLNVHPVRMRGWIDPRTLWELGIVLRRQDVSVACVNIDKEVRQTALTALGRRGFRIVARRGSPVPIKDNWHYRFVYERVIDRLIVNCRALVDKICADTDWFDRSMIRVIYNGCDVNELRASATPGKLRAELKIGAERPVVSVIGEVGWRKAQDMLLTAAASLRGRFPQTVYLIVGEGDGLADLRDQSRRLGLDDGTVRFLGFRRDVPNILADTDVLALPSRSEGFPNTLLEGMALGVPVVATAVDGIPELVADEQTGALVQVDNTGAFTAALARLLSDAELQRAWGEAGRRRVLEHFDEKTVLDKVEDCLTVW